MRTSALIRIVVWSAVALLILTILLAGIAGSLFSNALGYIPFFRYNASNNYSSQYDYNQLYTAGNGSVSATDITAIDIEWIEGAVTVLPADTDVITFSETSRYELEERYKLHYYVRDGRLSIQYCESRAPLNFRYAFGKSLTVTLPRELYLNMFQVEAVSAKVQMDAVNADTIQIEAVSGSLSVSNSAARTVNVDAVSGRIALESVTADSLTVTGISGETRIEQSQIRNVNCELVSGSIYIEPGADVRELNTQTVSGSIRLILPEHAGFTARYNEGSGHFRCDFPVEMKGKRTAVYNGGGAEFEFSSISGSVSIEQG